ncbi:MAG: peptide chain release factor 1 [Candidatus Wildermuthbacteria bacterium RIFCSPHIGHO2_02_FULL_49_9]|uniref:Peptide chain release factor 1 n=2 Tax=Candidatus Wildermuthiibacteriota TaxID=1817923 RepID=A0A1G2QWS7_9BACT|nr:MAG: peptide chain release factor 1 [Candidatus Wildermuthbacteria bacterium RIFCSPHIGHO2_01_FULL_49_22b]OHA70887.1 MAG: peptide chain release factor 1 [Candidatus Wildermuthbacteria bacterium RIFCSPHIGHO2_02_FULL_49_9]
MDITSLQQEYDAVLQELQNPALISDWERFQELSKKKARMEKILKKSQEAEDLRTQLQENLEMLGAEDQPELLSLAEEELKTLQEKLKAAEQELQELLATNKENLPQALIMEFRAGTGGEEAALFAADLLSMYQKYAAKKGWLTTLIEEDRTDIGGIKSAAIEIEGQEAFLHLQYEAGVHRVQRIPTTEKAGRIHTSTATVALFPRAAKTQFQINSQDLKVEFTNSSGPGGQNVNKRQTAVRLTHVPTGLVVFSQSSRSQQKNKEAALSLLESKLLQQKEEKEEKEAAGKRKAQIGWAKRVEKIRTYNFPQNRVTDHRIEKSWHGLENIMAGNLDPVIQSLREYQRSSAEKA